jgi:hypothetical protein
MVTGLVLRAYRRGTPKAKAVVNAGAIPRQLPTGLQHQRWVDLVIDEAVDLENPSAEVLSVLQYSLLECFHSSSPPDWE